MQHVRKQMAIPVDETRLFFFFADRQPDTQHPTRTEHYSDSKINCEDVETVIS